MVVLNILLLRTFANFCDSQGFLHVQAGETLRPIGYAAAHFEMDLRDSSCHWSARAKEAQGFQRLVGGHCLVV